MVGVVGSITLGGELRICFGQVALYLKKVDAKNIYVLQVFLSLSFVPLGDPQRDNFAHASMAEARSRPPPNLKVRAAVETGISRLDSAHFFL